MSKLLVCVAILLSFSITAPSAFTNGILEKVSEGKVDEALMNTAHVRFLPPNPIYYTIRIKEKFNRFFTASAVKRAEFDFMISGKRLKEAYLLIEQGKLNHVRGVLFDYYSSTDKSALQLVKAKTQNQEIIPAVDMIIDRLEYHETLLIYLKTTNDTNQEVEIAIGSFESYVNQLEKIKPGIRQRFKLLKVQNKPVLQFEALPSPKAGSVEATSTSQPRRIIY